MWSIVLGRQMMSETDSEDVDVEQFANETVRLTTAITRVANAPDIVTGEVSGSGKTISVTHPHSEDKTFRLDTATIMAGDSEFRDSRSFTLYTREDFQNTQQANYGPGPQAGSNGASDAADLPEPTHTPVGQDTEDDSDDDPDGDADAGEDDGEPVLDVTTVLTEREELEAVYRSVFMGETREDVGDVLGVSSGTVSNVVTEARSAGTDVETAILSRFTDDEDPRDGSEDREHLTAVVDMGDSWDPYEGREDGDATEGEKSGGGAVCEQVKEADNEPDPNAVCDSCGTEFYAYSPSVQWRRDSGVDVLCNGCKCDSDDDTEDSEDGPDADADATEDGRDEFGRIREGERVHLTGVTDDGERLDATGEVTSVSGAGTTVELDSGGYARKKASVIKARSSEGVPLYFRNPEMEHLTDGEDTGSEDANPGSGEGKTAMTDGGEWEPEEKQNTSALSKNDINKADVETLGSDSDALFITFRGWEWSFELKSEHARFPEDEGEDHGSVEWNYSPGGLNLAPHTAFITGVADDGAVMERKYLLKDVHPADPDGRHERRERNRPAEWIVEFTNPNGSRETATFRGSWVVEWFEREFPGEIHNVTVEQPE